MQEGRDLKLRFQVINADNLSPREFIDLFWCADDFIRTLTATEVRAFLEFMEVSSRDRIEALRGITAAGTNLPPVAEVSNISRGSWWVDTVVPSLLMLWSVRHLIPPVLQESWNESAAREKIKEYVRDKAFGGAAASLEGKAGQTPRYGGLKVSDIRTTRASDSQDVDIVITVERHLVVQLPNDDGALLERFSQRLLGEDQWVDLDSDEMF